jgi:hypothetical protein
MNTRRLIIAYSLFLFVFQIGLPEVAGNGPLRVRGYIREMPAMRLDRDFSDPAFVNLIHNRINLRLDLADNLYLALEGRNRLFYNEMFREFPAYRDILEADEGLIDMSWVWLQDGSWMGHSMIDRLHLDWSRNNWKIRAGRQRINWGVNLVSNPNDLFNTYSFFDFDYKERPGADALRIQYHTGFASRIEMAYSPARHARESTGAVLWSVNHKGYDIQTLAGYYRNRLAAGIGWAGNIRGAGFKGEATWFYDLEKQSGTERGNMVAATGIDYMFGNGTFAVLELLYNGGYGRTGEGAFMITQPLRPDNIMFSKYAVTLSAQHPFSNLLQGGLALMALPDIEAVFVMPSLNYSLMRNLDMEFVAQLFAGGENGIFSEAGSSFYILIQYSF